MVAKIGTGHSSEFLTSIVVELPVGLNEIRKSKEKKIGGGFYYERFL